MEIKRRPPWLRKRLEFNKEATTKHRLNEIGVNTVCREAHCPNISECFLKQHATFLILGRVCSRTCAFCNVTKAKPEKIDHQEPEKITQAAIELKLKHVVITSVTRDDLPDGGASIFAATVETIRKKIPEASIELLIPDFQGNISALKTTTHLRPEIIGHNMETVKRLYGLRPQADYKRSLSILKTIKEIDQSILTKSALMLGLGETKEEVINVMKDLRKNRCDYLALGQYLRPSFAHTDVKEYIRPSQFDEYKKMAHSLGFKHTESGPYVRSSYKAINYLSSR